MPDYYLQDRSRLQGQPKRTIADYVESQGILVPRRFDSLKEARASGLPILVRSEHEQDYDGVSGMLNSFGLENLPLDESKIKEMILGETPEYHSLYPFYCSLLSINESKFKKEVSFSLWEKLEGHNHAVVADSAVEGRYHIMTAKFQGPDPRLNYALVEGEKITEYGDCHLTPELRATLPDLIVLYERVRTLPRFDSIHCPLLEIQTVGNQHYFLQYHRTRDFVPVSFFIKRKPRREEVPALFVRGATPAEGLTCKVTIAYEAAVNDPGQKNWKLLSREDGSLENHDNWMFTELMVQKRKVQLIALHQSLDWVMGDFVSGHLLRSRLYKPFISIIVDKNELFTPEEESVLWKKARQTDQDQHINIHLISDGRKAYLKRV